VTLDRKQQLFLDAVEESFKFVRLAYTRLLATLEEHDTESPKSHHVDALILDCWVIVDLAKRIRTMLQNTPGLKHNEALQRFLDSTNTVPEFRHYIQHLETEARDVAPMGHPIWGSVSWAKLLSERSVSVGTYVPGRLAKCKGIPVVNPAGRQFHGQIDHIELAHNGQVINLSDLVRCIERFAGAFSAAVSAAERVGQRDCNGLIRFEVVPEES